MGWKVIAALWQFTGRRIEKARFEYLEDVFGTFHLANVVIFKEGLLYDTPLLQDPKDDVATLQEDTQDT